MRSTVLVCLLLQPCFALADEKTVHNTLTPEEIADGWILLFDGKTTFGWASPNGSKWWVVDGMLYPEKGKQPRLVTTTPFADYELKLDYRRKEGASMTMIGNSDARGREVAQGSVVKSWEGERDWYRFDYRIRKGRVEQSEHTRLGGTGIIMVTDGEDFNRGPETKPFPKVGFLTLAGQGFVVRNIKIRPLNTRPLLNGKDLTGWREHPGLKSKFSVTKDGHLSVKDGRGDLQTTGQWDNFVLQLDCKTLGKHLNSGVFFRCLPGEYQMGYEAQIHNGFGPEKEYALEVFDPKTHKPLEKKKEKYAALDYGTGAIYRRQPARLQASKDNEWFAMTVVADGRHLATWVNGIQVVDWTDNRPLAENARKGAYLKKGPISIQGHDPTTDLLFRNIRIAELPGK